MFASVFVQNKSLHNKLLETDHVRNRPIHNTLFCYEHCVLWTGLLWTVLLSGVAKPGERIMGLYQWRNWRGAGGAAAPPGRSFRSFWAPCHHIVNFIKWSLIDIAPRQCVVLMIFGTLNYKNTLFLEKYRKTSHHFFNLEHRNQTLLKNSA